LEQQQDSDIYIPPSQGPDPLLQGLRKNPLVASLHVALGDFPKALELLRKQLAITSFEPLKQIFVDVYTLNKLKI
jgi:Coatomer (COPI) alpha subunit C-terminus